jgi:phage terminase large subunit-like protein
MSARGARAADAGAAAGVEAYARAVVAGEVVANRYVRLACERHLRDLATGPARGLRFDAAKAGRAIRFFGFLRLAEGSFEGRPFTLSPWQVFIVGSLFGWYAHDADGSWVRRFRNGYVETGKGSGKTPMAAGIGLFGMVGDDEAAAEVYSAAKVRYQAAILWSDARRMVERSPALRSRIEVTAHSLAMPSRDATFIAVSSEARNLHGPRVHIGLIDEEHAHPDSEVIDAMRAGTKGRRNALILRITNAGYDRHSVCWADHEYSTKVLEGVLLDDAWFAFVAGLDACEQHRPGGAPVDGCARCDAWTDETVWPKANPNLGVSLPIRYLREMVTEALGKPSAAASVKRLCFCIWTEGSGKWLDPAAFAALADCSGPAPLPAGRSAWGGLDLASTADLTAFVLVAPRDACRAPGHTGRCYDLRARFWLPQANLAARVSRDHVPYDVWATEGWIALTPGNRVDQERILADVTAQRHARAIGVDRWNTAWLTPRLQAEGFEVVEVGQGYASLSAPAKRLEADIAAGLVHHDGNPVLRWMVANAAAEEDAAGNIKPSREKSSEKIDGVAAWCDALFAWGNAEPEEEWHSVYEGLTAEQVADRMVLRW